MRIDTIEIIRVAMPLKEPFRTACGDDSVNESVLVKFTSGGLYGWGEAASGREPTYCPECAASQYLVSRDFIAPLLLGGEIESGGGLQARLSHVRGNTFAKAAFDLAWWDLRAKGVGEPLWRFIGGEAPTVEVGADFGIMDTVEELLDKIRGAVERGCLRVKLKVRPGWDIDTVASVRKHFPRLTIHVDCNSAYTLDDIDLFREFDKRGLFMIEQPLAHDDLVDHAELSRMIETPVCLDESVTSPADARKAISLGSCRWINIKPGRVGGLTPSLAIHDICLNAGIGCWVGGMLESAVGASHCLALATLPHHGYPSDVFPSDRFFERDLGKPPLEHSGPSTITARSVPGIGAEPDPDLLGEWTVEKIVMKG